MTRGRHFEHVDRNPRYYFELHDHPNFRGFAANGGGDTIYIDEEGREYRVAEEVQVRAEHPRPTPRPAGNGLVKLYVRLPTPDVPWYPAQRGRVRVLLTHAHDGHSRIATIKKRSILLPGHRTGHVFVSRTEWEHNND